MGIITTLLVKLLEKTTEHIATASKVNLDFYVLNEVLVIKTLLNFQLTSSDMVNRMLTSDPNFSKGIERIPFRSKMDTKLIKLELVEYKKWNLIIKSIFRLSSKTNETEEHSHLDLSTLLIGLQICTDEELQLQCTPAEVGWALKAYQLFNNHQLPIKNSQVKSFQHFISLYNLEESDVGKVKGGFNSNKIKTILDFDVEFIKIHRSNIETKYSKEKIAKFIQDNES